jgi:dipeptidyl aminopeptidase/acylaminoacyl peptidase
MTDIDRDLRDMMQRTADGVHHVPRPSRGLVNRARIRRVRTAAFTGAAVVALVIGGFAGARSLSSDRAIPPADPSPNGSGDVSGWITHGDERGIWARDLTSRGDPADRVRLSSTPGTPVAWSRDGSKLLVVRDVPPTDPSVTFSTDLFVVNSDGTETRLTDANGSINGSSFSPDGAAVVYAVGREDGSSAIYVVDAEGGSPQVLRAPGRRRVPGEPGRFETELQEPKWSPDGSQIAYFDGMGDWGHSLRVMDTDGTDSRVVVENDETLGAGHVYGLEWSPDGSQLAFSIEGRLYVVGVDGSGFRLVTDNGVGPYWSPDGSHIAYTRPEVLEGSERGSLETVRLDDLQVQNFGDGESGPWTADMEWSASAR